jgi:uncharacterized protein YndB with AHSA1/START domain
MFGIAIGSPKVSGHVPFLAMYWVKGGEHVGLLDAVMARGIEEPGLRGKAEVLVLAPADRLYQLVSDVTRMGEWSPECYRCEWLDRAMGPAVGARFKGYNRRGWLRWSMICTVTAAEPGRVFAFEVRPRGGKVQSRWRYELEPVEGGTILRESFEAFWYIRLVVRLFFGGGRNRLEQLEDSVRQTLQRIKAVAESEQVHTMD